MDINLINTGDVYIAEILSNQIEINNTQDALDIMANCAYQDADRIILYKENIIESFFDLKTTLAGDILQKFSNYRARLAIVGDFSKYTSKVMQWGNLIKKHHELPDLSFQPVNISKLSWKFFPGLSNAEIRKNTQEDVKIKSDKWAKLYPNATPLKVIPAEDKNIASALMYHVKQERADLLIMGVQGVTSLTTLFMGSVANEVLNLESNACLLFVKHSVEA